MNLRNKLLLSFLIFIASLVALGVWSALSLRELGEVSQHIISSNYDSVVAASFKKESLERMDSAALFLLLKDRDRAMRQFKEHRPGSTRPSRRRRGISQSRARLGSSRRSEATATNITGASRLSSPREKGVAPAITSNISNRFSIRPAPNAISFYSSISARWPRSPSGRREWRGANCSSR